MRIILATGGSGGHLFPAIKVAQELDKDGHDVFFVGSFGLRVQQINDNGFQFKDLKTQGINFSNILKGVASVGRMLKAIVASFRLLSKFKPNAVVGFGGHGSFPVVFAAVILRFPTLIHEQNVVPGRANALLSKFVKKIAISFSKSKQYFNSSKTVLTGCPSHIEHSRKEKSEILKGFGLLENKTTILVVGGSQGSHRINEAFFETARSLKDKLNFQVIHICGHEDFSHLNKKYWQLGVPFALFEFLDEMELGYAVCDLVISRAGAVTVTELAMLQIPAILIPYPYAQDHQKQNGLILEEAKIAKLIDEKELTVEILQQNILEMIGSEFDMDEIRRNLEGIFVSDSSKRLAQEAINLV